MKNLTRITLSQQDDSIMYVTDGKQIFQIESPQTERYSKPKPKRKILPTEARMAQRAQLSNLISTYRILSAFIKEKAYPFKPKTQKAYNLFIKQNLGRIKVYLDKTEAEAKACVVAPYNLSMGSLMPIEIKAKADRMITSLRVPESFPITDTTTTGEVSLALINVNEFICCNDCLTVIHLVQTFVAIEETIIPYIIPRLYEFIIKPTSQIPFYTLMPASLFRVNEGYIGTDSGIETGGMAYILSRKMENKADISTQSVVLTPDNVTYRKYSSEQQKQKVAISYGVAAPVFVDPKIF
jgi:hypothetical protein